MQPLTKDTLTQINTTICGDERSLEVLQNKGIVKAYTKGYRIYNDMLLFHHKNIKDKNTKDNNGKDKTNPKARSRPF